MARVPITTTIDSSIKALGDKLDIPMSKLLEFGILFKYAEHKDTVEGYYEYPSNRLSWKLERAMKKLEEYANKYYETEEGKQDAEDILQQAG